MSTSYPPEDTPDYPREGTADLPAGAEADYPAGGTPPVPMAEPLPPAAVEPLPPPEYPPPGPGDLAGAPQSTTDVVKDQAASVGQTGVQAGRQTAEVARQQAAEIAAETSRQARSLLRQAQDELEQQAADGQRRLADQLRSLGEELASMADGSGQDGMAADLARQTAGRLRQAGGWLGERKPADVTAEVESFARRRPGAFIALALGAGLAAGRLTRGMKDAAADDQESAPAPSAAARPELATPWTSRRPGCPASRRVMAIPEM